MVQQKDFSSDTTEKCVLCGGDSGYKQCTPIEQRQFYVEGSGQLCEKCFDKVYVQKNESLETPSEDVPTEAEALPQYPNEGEFDYKVKYSDEYYDMYIKNFVPNQKRRLGYRFFKRMFDILISLFGLIVASPFMLIIAIAVKLDSKGPIIFKQKRMGRGGKPFDCYKFRSMKIDAPKNCATSVLGDPTRYLTRTGRILRKLSLDELPQLFCCLIGTMSIIGPRPLVLTESNCNDMRMKLGVFAMRPGISGYAQVLGRDDVYYKNKAILDAEYVKKASLFFDLKLIVKTVLVVLKREGNDAEKIGKGNKK